MRTKADFKALRETLGLTQQNVAGMAGVRVLAVKRWEKPGEAEPPEDVWRALDEMRGRMLDMAGFAADKAVEMRDGTGAESVALTYYRSQDQYDAVGREPGPYGFANAAARLTADYLEAEGFEVEFRYPDDGAIVTPGSGYAI